MSISSRITQIEQHLTDDYSVLEVAGADLTNVDKNIVNLKMTWQERLLYFINNGTDVVWNNWEKVEGTGETITLNSTEEAPMKINLKGNTSQETTTGKNLFNNNQSATLNLSATATSIDTGIRITSPTGAVWTGCIYKLFNVSDMVGEKFTVSCKATPSGSNAPYVAIGRCDANGENRNMIINSTNTGNISITATIPTISDTSEYLYVAFDGNSTGTVIANSYVDYTNLQLEKSATATSYEEYTGVIASPNPDYPQDIHVVSGDNSINVCGKNLWGEEEHGGIDESTGVDFYNATRWRTVGFISTQPNTSYTISSNASSNIWYIFYYYDKNKNFISSKTLLGTTSVNWETPSNCKYMRCVIADTASITTTQRQLEKGSTATTYEAYKGASYPISLGVENLLDESVMTASTTNCHIVDNVIGTNVLSTWNAFQVNINSIKLEANVDYYATFKAKVSSGSCNLNYGGNLYDGTNWATQNRVSTDYTLTSEFKEFCWKITTTSENFVATKMGFQVGGTASSPVIVVKDIVFSKVPNAPYLPYGKAIELCKIGDYQDSIKKSTGKNLFDKDNVNELNATINSSGVISSNNNCKTIYIPIKPNTTYTMQKVLSTQFRASVYDEEPQINSTGTNTIANFSGTIITITSTTNSKYLALFCYINTDTQTYQQILDSIMINEGSTALPYEPYGKVWYLNKQIGKVVLDGSEEWKIGGTYSGITQFDVNANTTNIPETILKVLSNYFRGVVWKNSWTINKCISIGLNIIRIMTSDYTTVADFKAWLSEHNTEVYYVLETPTYTEITDTTLLSQLDTIKRSYDEQTNITQVNNDLPFILDVTALKQLTQ